MFIFGLAVSGSEEKYKNLSLTKCYFVVYLKVLLGFFEHKNLKSLIGGTLYFKVFFLRKKPEEGFKGDDL